MIRFPGATRRRHVEITTKSGNTVAGSMLREKDGIVQLKFTSDSGEDATVSVDVDSIDVLIVGERTDDGVDTDE